MWNINLGSVKVSDFFLKLQPYAAKIIFEGDTKINVLVSV